MPQDGGYVDYGSNVEIGYYDQENHELNPSNTVLEEIWQDYPFMTQTEVRDALALFLFKADDVFKQVKLLSGGEKARLTLAKLMLTKMNLLILDEPTNHLDIPSRERLEDAILGFDGTIIAVSHDRYFINKLATRIFSFNLESPNLICDFKGGYKEYLEFADKKRQESHISDDEKGMQMTSSKEQYLADKKNQAEKRKLENRIKKSKDELEKIEARITKIDEEMAGDAAYDHIRLTELTVEKEKLESRLMELYEFLDGCGEAI